VRPGHESADGEACRYSGAGGSKQPTRCTCSDGLCPLPPQIPSPSHAAPRKGQLGAQEQPKKQNNCQKITRNKAKNRGKKVASYIWGNCSCQHTHTARDASQARKDTFPTDATELETGPDRPLVGPHMVAAHVVIEGTAVGFLRGSDEPLGVGGGWDGNA